MDTLQINSNDRITTLGQTGSGKSNFVKYFSYFFPKIVVHDYKNEWDSRYGLIVTDIFQLEKALKEKAPRIILQTKEVLKGEALNFFHTILYDFFYNYMFIFEEVDRYAKTHQLPPKFDDILNLGRDRGQGMIMISRRIGKINLDCVANSQIIISFYQFMDRDLDRLREIMGNVIYELPKLPPYYFLTYHVKSRTYKINKPIRYMPNWKERT